MVAEGQGVSDKWAAKLSAQSEAHRKELRRHHDTWAASEKVRREKWMGEKTAQVKAQTIRGPSHPTVSPRIWGGRTTPFSPFLVPNRAPHGVTPRS